MQRRHFLTASTGLALVAVSLVAQQTALAQPRFTVSAAQLQQRVAERFPLHYPLAGLMELDVQAPRLRLLPEQNRLAAEMVVVGTGPALRRSIEGRFDVDFALRYEASDRSLRAHKLRFQNLYFSELQAPAAELLKLYGPVLAAQSLQELVLHQLRPQDLALADGLGLQPGDITVTEDGLVISFVAKPQ